MMKKQLKKLGNNLLLIDYNNVMHKMIHTNSRLTFSGKFTGGVYGFIRQLISTCDDLNIDHVIVCKDSPPYIRKDILPEYKGDRKTHDEVFYMKMTQTKSFIDEFLGLAGIQLEDHNGFEADDIIAQGCKTYTLRFNKIYVRSNDDDLYQLLRFKNVTLLRNKGLNYTYENFKEEFDMNPLKWIDVNALKGSHNNIRGIKGVGIKTAIKIVKDKDLFEKYYTDNEQMILLNRKLIKLPYSNLTIPIKKLPYDEKGMKLFLRKTGIRGINNTELDFVLTGLN